ncbi:Nucleotide-binding universal stress protein, UspA family [Actinopolyspora xinjiangensis]|uniref:Nucleotide-binding universal stress protein, UspA family n=1 Tax=Actinopolyspora xinjiangensis TaxID=405564 RepID=A0A1H0S151_9ACTN|nr:universal stress protein [Actinopolyspora xinjiangensis]SDP35480.1 Nucleotide-binding universal stress protein, UspA family [Actinopolyspora xinjiangensis]
MAASHYRILVGADGSESARRAADWAVAEARRRGETASLGIVLVNDDPAREEYARETTAEIEHRCREALPHLRVNSEVVEGHPVEGLARRSTRADLLVLGSRGHGPVADALLGSVSVGVARRTRCPLVVVRGEQDEPREKVVVGVDDSAASDAALEFGFASARERTAELLVMRAAHRKRREAHDTDGRDLTERLKRWGAWFPEVTARRVDVEEHPVTGLLELARSADLVVGRRGSGGFGGLMLGSVARSVLHHASCPVAVVPGAEEQD